jgi:predicted Zn-dependent protease
MRWLAWVVVGLLWCGHQASFAQSPPNHILHRVLQANGMSTETVSDIRIENSDSLNAYTNGQQIVLSSALWNGLKTEDERAFVISHEAAHVVLQHIQQTQFRRVGLGLFQRYVVGRFLDPNSQLAALGLTLVDRRFSRNVEYQADDLGLKMLKKANYDPNAALSVFRFLGQANSSGRLPEFFSTHPISESRIRNLVTKYKLQG